MLLIYYYSCRAAKKAKFEKEAKDKTPSSAAEMTPEIIPDEDEIPPSGGGENSSHQPPGDSGPGTGASSFVSKVESAEFGVWGPDWVTME